MRKKKTATEEIVAYFDSCGTGRTRVSAARIHAELPSKGEFDSTTPRERVENFAKTLGLTVTAEGGTDEEPGSYLFVRM